MTFQRERPAAIQCARIVELSAQRREAARRTLVELRRLYLDLEESGKAGVRAQLNQLKRLEVDGAQIEVRMRGAVSELPWGRR
jgi:hypothetical protein